MEPIKSNKAASSPNYPTDPVTSMRIAGKLAVDGKTLPEAYLRRLEVTPQRAYFRYKSDGAYKTVSWEDFHVQVLKIFQFQNQAGVKSGDRVCIFSESRPEWIMIDVCNQAMGAITVPIYHSNTEEDVAYILTQAEPSLIYVDDAHCCEKIAAAFTKMGRKIPIVALFDSPPKQNFPFTLISEIQNTPTGPDAAVHFKQSALAVRADDTASIVYTSGTTGLPKGVVLTQSNFATELRSIVNEIDLLPTDSTLTFLPFAHILGRVESLLPIYAGIVLNFAENINTVAQDIAVVGPTILLSVPRIYEKIYARIQAEVQSQSEIKRTLFFWAVGVGRQYARLKAQKAMIPIPLLLKFKVANKLVFSKIRAKLGGNIRFTVSGGAPLSPELCEIFHACGIKILEGYGLTETTAAVAVNRPDDYGFSTVGKPLGKTEIKIASDGEILLRGPLVFKEYYKNPEATRETLSAEGWYATGDVGEIDDRGFLRITDRKKELIVTSGGKNVAPQKIENLIKTCRYVSNVLVCGDKQKYIAALLTLNEPEIEKWAKQSSISFSSYSELSKEPKLHELLSNEMKTINAQLASYESVKRFRILPADFTVETGELTPSLKVKRKVCSKKFSAEIEALYA